MKQKSNSNNPSNRHIETHCKPVFKTSGGGLVKQVIYTILDVPGILFHQQLQI